MKPARPYNLSSPPSTLQGLSLIELLISMAIGLVLVVTVGYAYLGAKQSFRTQEALSRIQENARYAFEFMASDIRMAGFTGGPSGVGTRVVNNPTAWDPNLIDLFGTPLLGGATAPPNVTACGTPPACYRGGDTLNVVRADNDTEYAITVQADPNITLAAASDLQTGQILVLADYTQSAVFRTTAVAGTSVTYNAGAGALANSTSALGSFGGVIGSRKIYPLRGVTYFIGTNRSGEPALYRRILRASATVDSEELVEGVQNMQITYGVDTDATADNTVNSYVAASVVTNNTGGVFDASVNTAQKRWARVLSVRINLTMVSRQGQAVTPGGLLQKNFSTTIAVRNRLP